MSKNQDKRKTWLHVSNHEHVAMTNGPERIMRNPASSSFLTAFSQAELWSEAVKNRKKVQKQLLSQIAKAHVQAEYQTGSHTESETIHRQPVAHSGIAKRIVQNDCRRNKHT